MHVVHIKSIACEIVERFCGLEGANSSLSLM